MGTVIGYALIVISIGWIAYKMNVSYNSAGGTAFAVPVYDAAIYPPILTAVGLYLASPSMGIEWPVWIYVAIGLVLIPVIVGDNSFDGRGGRQGVVGKWGTGRAGDTGTRRQGDKGTGRQQHER